MRKINIFLFLCMVAIASFFISNEVNATTEDPIREENIKRHILEVSEQAYHLGYLSTCVRYQTYSVPSYHIALIDPLKVKEMAKVVAKEISLIKRYLKKYGLEHFYQTELTVLMFQAGEYKAGEMVEDLSRNGYNYILGECNKTPITYVSGFMYRLD